MCSCVFIIAMRRFVNIFVNSARLTVFFMQQDVDTWIRKNTCTLVKNSVSLVYQQLGARFSFSSRCFDLMHSFGVFHNEKWSLKLIIRYACNSCVWTVSNTKLKWISFWKKLENVLKKKRSVSSAIPFCDFLTIKKNYSPIIVRNVTGVTV